MSETATLPLRFAPGTYPPRPSLSDTEIRDALFKRAVDDLWPSLREWGSHPESDKEGVLSDVASASSSFFSDGYEIAKQLDDRFGWSCDSGLVDILDGLSSAVLNLEYDVVRQWVQAYHVTPRLALGTVVKVKARKPGEKRGDADQVYDGEIIYIDEIHAVYSVFIAAIGHIRKGEGNGYTSQSFPCEEVEAGNPELIPTGDQHGD